jgi:hypothetical protein
LRNQKLTNVIKGRIVRSATVEHERLIVVFDDHSTMTVKTARGLAAAISAGAKVKAVMEDADECTLQFEDGSSVTVKLANPGASVAVRARNSAVEYLG